VEVDSDLLLLALTLWCLWFIHRWSGKVIETRNTIHLLRPLVAPLAALILVLLANFLTNALINVSGMAAEWVQFVLPAVSYLAIAWLAWLVAIFVAEAIISSPRISDQSLDAHLLRLLARVAGLSVVIVIFFWGGNRLGLPTYGLIAGVSVGGLAIALAAQGTLENVIGSINLFADRPVRVGDLCRYGDDIGTVEEIGLRSTTIPNADFSKMKIVNFSRRDRMLLRTMLGLRYETTPDQLRHVLAKLRELLISHPRVHGDRLRVRFVGFGDFSLNLEVFAYLETQDLHEFLGIQEDLLLRMMSIVEHSGTGFAFPSRTLYLSRDGGLDAQRGQAAEQEVQAWREQQGLPFPDFAPEVVERIRHTLDFPPMGSPDANSNP
jgi:MscS family membrane protein